MGIKSGARDIFRRHSVKERRSVGLPNANVEHDKKSTLVNMTNAHPSKKNIAPTYLIITLKTNVAVHISVA